MGGINEGLCCMNFLAWLLQDIMFNTGADASGRKLWGSSCGAWELHVFTPATCDIQAWEKVCVTKTGVCQSLEDMHLCRRRNKIGGRKPPALCMFWLYIPYISARECQGERDECLKQTYSHVNIVLFPSTSPKRSWLPCSSPRVAGVAKAKDNFLLVFFFFFHRLMCWRCTQLRSAARSESSLSI